MSGKEPERTAGEAWMDRMGEANDLRRRRHKRFGRSGSVSMRRMVSGPTLTGDLFDVSVGGCLVWTDDEHPFALSELIEIGLNAQPLVMRVMGTVRYQCEQGRLLGIEFWRLSQKETWDLQQFMRVLQANADAENRLSAR